MKKVEVTPSVETAANYFIKTLQEKGFTIFCDVDHQANAKKVDLTIPPSRTLIFGNPAAGTKLMQKDITISLDLPLRIAVVEHNEQTLVIHQTSDDYSNSYNVEGHPVLEKIDALFSGLIAGL